MAWTRASQLQRSLQCSGSAFLYNTVPAIRLARKSDNALNAAEYGNIAHGWKQHGRVIIPAEPSDRFESANKTFQKKLAYLASRGITREMVWPGGYHEVSVAYNCLDGRIAVDWCNNPDKFKRSYIEEWVTGTCDWVKFENNGLLRVDDLKTGAMFDEEPDAMAQMYFYCMVFAKLWRPVKVLSSVTLWPKYPVENEPERVEAEITLNQLTKFEARIRSEYNRYITQPRYRLGGECTYCPALPICPLQKN